MGINRVILCGVIGRSGVVVHYNQAGTPCANFTLQLSEQGQDGKVHTLYQDCEVWGRRAEAAGELEPGQLALFEGKLARRKQGENWTTVIAGFEVTAVVPPVVMVSGSTN
jgi:single-stranded DNA-binding protein